MDRLLTNQPFNSAWLTNLRRTTIHTSPIRSLPTHVGLVQYRETVWGTEYMTNCGGISFARLSRLRRGKSIETRYEDHAGFDAFYKRTQAFVNVKASLDYLLGEHQYALLYGR